MRDLVLVWWVFIAFLLKQKETNAARRDAHFGGYTFLSLGTVTWHNTYAPPGRGPGLAKLLLTSKTPSVAPAIPGPRRSPPDPRRHRECAPVGLAAPVSGLLLVCHRAPDARDLLLSHSFLSQRVPIFPPLLSLSLDAQAPLVC